MKVALYARVSTPDQDPSPQLTVLRKWAQANEHDVVKEAVEVASTRLVRRPEKEAVMAMVRGRHAGGVVVCKLDRWGRSLIDLHSSLTEIQSLGGHFYAIDQGIALKGKQDAMGGLLLNVMSAFAEFERELISERTKAALAAKKAAGVVLGRPWWKVKGMPKPTGEKSPETPPLVNDRLESGQKGVAGPNGVLGGGS